MINHGLLTDALISKVSSSSGQLVGDGVAPDGGGWASGQPNQGIFVPYIVVVSQGARVVIEDFTNKVDWHVTWNTRCFGGSRKQVDWIAQKARESIDEMNKTIFGYEALPYKVINVDWENLGAVTRIDTVNPPYWQVFDTFSLICSRVHI